MATDQHGNEVSGDAAAVALYDRATAALLRFHPDVVAATYELVGAAPDVAMGQALVAYLHLTSTDQVDVAGARAAHEAMSACTMDLRERGHHAAIGAWCDGRWADAAAILDSLSIRWPTDLLALQVGHQLDFFVGDAHGLRDRPGRALLALDPEHPHTGYVRGMQAFGLEESGHYGAAEAAGRQALDANADDVWAVHAVAHVHEMEGRVVEGIDFLGARVDDWGADTFMAVHTWWHLALFHLDAGRVDEVLAIHDREVHHAGSKGLPLELLDGAALLWRLHLDGHDTGDRFAALADAWTSRLDADPWYGFNDLHAVVALVGAGRVADAEARVARLAAAPGAMGVDIALPASAAVVAFGRGEYDDAVDGLLGIRRVAHRFGGSHAQRDILERTLLEAAVRARRHDLARALVSERLSRRPTEAYGRAQLARL